jgi:pSer/pThr/pTyr-binding forkhead associated (FHA) protein
VGPRYTLQFISGKYQGGEFPLPAEREIFIGRATDLDIVLVEEMVSRKHASISTNQGRVLVKDLDSACGTFVNGEKIKQQYLKDGDRLLIGSSIIKLVRDGA